MLVQNNDINTVVNNKLLETLMGYGLEFNAEIVDLYSEAIDNILDLDSEDDLYTYVAQGYDVDVLKAGLMVVWDNHIN